MKENLSKKAISKISISPGMVFDDFIIEELDHIDKRRKYIWKSRCLICGAICFFSTRRLHDNRHVYCKEHRKYNEPDISGETHGFLIVDGLSDIKTDDGYNIWDCHCKVCGKRLQRTYAQIKVTRGQSCGCIRNQKTRDNQFIDMTGQTYNNVFVKGLAYDSPKKKEWFCTCLICGKDFIAEGANIRHGNTKSCGCTRFKKLRELKFHDLTNQMFGSVLVKSFVGYKDQRAMWDCLCTLCNRQFVANGHDLISGDVQSCGCAKSHAERRIAKFLDLHGIGYEQQKSFDDCVDKGRLYFDFYIESRRCAVEYDGEFHYIETSLGNDLEGQQRRDAIKTKYCEENDIVLLRIPYWEKDNIESILSDWLFFNGNEEADSSDTSLSE